MNPMISSGVVARGLADRDPPALAQHGDPVGDREDVLDVVRDQDDRFALRAQPVDEAQDLADLGHRQGRRRLVHDDQIGVDVERAGDRDALPLPTGQRLDPDLEVGDVDVEVAQQCVRPGAASRRGPGSRSRRSAGPSPVPGRCCRRSTSFRRAQAPDRSSPRRRPRRPAARQMRPCALRAASRPRPVDRPRT